MPSDSNEKPKLLVLGGGMAALTAAFELTSRPGWKGEYDLHVYQMGWRLGGKGASGRDAGVHQRIEEHGLHVWPGFYDNAFQVIRQCYEELGRPPGAPLATWDEAFVPQNFIVVQEFIDGQWIHWPFTAPTNGATPGEPGELPSMWDYVSMALQLMRSWFEGSGRAPAATGELVVPAVPELSLIGRLRRLVERLLRRIGLRRVANWLANLRLTKVMKKLLPSAIADSSRLLEVAAQIAESTAAHVEGVGELVPDLLEWSVGRFTNWFRNSVANEIQDDDALRRLYIQLDFTAAAVRGFIVDLVALRGFESIDKYDFRDWLRRHGASDLTLQSGVIRGLYDFVFASVDGDPQQLNLAAGVALRLVARMSLTYKGAIMWEMRSGMGDVVFAPLYQVLRNRGVHFHFFHRVQSLELSPGTKTISQIKLARQATVAADSDGSSGGANSDVEPEYDPLVDVLGLPCWPNKPKFDALLEGAELEARNVDLESAWTDWQDVAEVNIDVRANDAVILGISLAALPHLCPELIAADRRWRKMLEKMKTVQTQAVQLWLSPSLSELGWAMGSPIMTAYAKPLETWADMTQTVPTEDWSEDLRPKKVAYFCGTLTHADEIPGLGPSDFPAQQRERVREGAIDWLSNNIGHLWPAGTLAQGAGLDWDKLVDVDGATGVARFDSQYCRANVNPTDRYVLSVAGSTKYRLDPANSGFTNLYLAGDWTENELDVGCIEAAVTSGRRAAKGILER